MVTATASASGQLAAVQLAGVQPSTTTAAAALTMAMGMAEENSSKDNGRLIKKQFGNTAAAALLFLMIVRHLQTGNSPHSVLLTRQFYIDLLRNVWHNVPQEEN